MMSCEVCFMIPFDCYLPASIPEHGTRLINCSVSEYLKASASSVSNGENASSVLK
jgi:hypothetical protein